MLRGAPNHRLRGAIVSLDDDDDDDDDDEYDHEGQRSNIRDYKVFKS